MKKLIQICSLLSLLIVFSVVSAKAQTIQRFKADIPFAFSVSGKSYEAGTYVLKLSNATVGKIMTIENDKNLRLQTFYVLDRGDIAKKSSVLQFVRNQENWSLAKLLTPEKGFTIAGASGKFKAAKNYGAADSETQTVSINLK